MNKFTSNKYLNKLELLDYSKFRFGYLNRQIIILLITLGVDPEVFSKMQQKNFEELDKKDFTDGNIFAYLNNDNHLSPTRDLLKDCISCDVNLMNEPFVKGVYETIRVRSFINLKEKANILNKKSVRIMGVLNMASSKMMKSISLILLQMVKLMVTEKLCRQTRSLSPKIPVCIQVI